MAARKCDAYFLIIVIKKPLSPLMTFLCQAAMTFTGNPYAV